MAGVTALPARRNLRWKGLVVPALLVQVAGMYLLPATEGALLRRLSLVAATLLLLAFVWANRSFWSVRVIGAGLLLNSIALGVGLGLMPVAPETMQAAGLGHLAAATGEGNPVAHSKDIPQ